MAGDWEARDDGHSWSVRNDIFRASYRHKHQDKWERTGTVLVRPARPGETIDTLEGQITADAGDFMIQGDRGEQWPVGSDEFRRRSRGPVPAYKPSKVPPPKPSRPLSNRCPERLTPAIAGRSSRGKRLHGAGVTPIAEPGPLRDSAPPDPSH